MVDAERLEQVVINLLGNSVKFTPSGGTITLSCGVDPTNASMARVQVSDTGIGIPADKLQSIFEPFTQLDMHHENREGVGLGLAISRRLTRLMGGDIIAQSDTKGATFTVTLPLARNA
jgi:signal transduction histidine kinase